MSDDILSRLRCSYEKDEWPCEQCTFCAARAEIEWLREMAYHRNEQLARAWDGQTTTPVGQQTAPSRLIRVATNNAETESPHQSPDGWLNKLARFYD